MRQAVAGVRTQPRAIWITVFLFTVLIPFTIPAPMTAPTMVWDVEMGTPKSEKMWIESSGELGGKGSGEVEGGDILPHRLYHPPAEGRYAQDNGQPTHKGEEGPDGAGDLFLVRNGSHAVGHIVRAEGKGHITTGKDDHRTEYPVCQEYVPEPPQYAGHQEVDEHGKAEGEKRAEDP